MADSLSADQILEELFTSVGGVSKNLDNEDLETKGEKIVKNSADLLDVSSCLMNDFKALLDQHGLYKKEKKKHKNKRKKKEKKKEKSPEDESFSLKKKKKKREKEKEDIEDGEIVDTQSSFIDKKVRSKPRDKEDCHDGVSQDEAFSNGGERAGGSKEADSHHKRVKDRDRYEETDSRRHSSHYGSHYSSSSFSQRHYDRHNHHYSSSSSSTRYSRRRSRSPNLRNRSRTDHERIDKAKLLEAARRNLQRMKANGTLPPSLVDANIEALKQPEVQQKSLVELTEYCQDLCGSGVEGGQTSCNDPDPSDDPTSSLAFTRHPYQLKSRPETITMNIRNAVALPVRKASELKAQLKEQFPVSSGTKHKTNESEWVPVKEAPKSTVGSSNIGVGEGGHRLIRNTLNFPIKTSLDKEKELGVVVPVRRAEDPTLGLQPATVDIGTIVAKRLEALRRITENPLDYEAQMELRETKLKATSWVKSGRLQSEDGVQQLVDWSGQPQAWARKDQLKDAVPLNSGIGLRMLQKMGWQPGEGLGRNSEGSLEPLALDIKMDKKGLVSRGETSKPLVHKLTVDFSGRHPVSALNELCLKRRWGPPLFEQIMEAGPDHLKSFLYKVIVNKVEYRPAVASPNKKEARVQAAAVCLQALDILPRPVP